MRTRLTALAALTGLLGTVAVGALALPAHAAGTYTWAGQTADPAADGHSWTDARNWSPAGVPGTGDSVVVAPPGTECGAHVDGLPTGLTLASLDLHETGNPTTANLCDASLAGGSITVTQSLTWDGGMVSSPLTVAVGATGIISGTHADHSLLAAALQLGGTLSLVNAVDEGAFKVQNPFVLHILSGGTLQSTGSNAIVGASCCVQPARITNDGTVRVSHGTLLIDGVAFDQRRHLVVAGGTLATHGAPGTAAARATYSGKGRWQIQGSGDATRFTGTQTLGSGFQLELGGASTDDSEMLGGSFSLAGTGTFNWAGGVVEGNVTIGHSVTVQLSGSQAGNAKRILSGTDYTGPKERAAAFVNHGRVVVTRGAQLWTEGVARFTNAADGSVTLAAGTVITSMSCCVNPDRITNNGVVTVQGGTHAKAVTISMVAYVQRSGRTQLDTGAVLRGILISIRGGKVTGRGRLVHG